VRCARHGVTYDLDAGDLCTHCEDERAGVVEPWSVRPVLVFSAEDGDELAELIAAVGAVLDKVGPLSTVPAGALERLRRAYHPVAAKIAGQL
jgi:hypothetical protein